jgi:hypothetical protein
MKITMQRGAGAHSYLCEPAGEVGMFAADCGVSLSADKVRINIGAHLPVADEWKVSFVDGVIKVTPPAIYKDEVDPDYAQIVVLVPKEHRQRIAVVGGL